MLKQTLFANAVEALKTDERMRDPTEQNEKRFQELNALAKARL